MNVISPGSRVRLADGVEGVVTAVCLMEQNHVRYECVWWDGRTRNQHWLEACEVEPAEGAQNSRIGFQINGAMQ